MLTARRGNTGDARSLVPRSGNDCVYTLKELALRICGSLPIAGRALEPCSGDGAFLEALSYSEAHTIDACELAQGIDFFNYILKVDWIVANPPWSKFAEFLEHSLEISDNVVFLVTLNHFTTKKRLRLIKEAGFGFQEIRLIDTPKNFPQSGFQIVWVWLQRNWKGECKWEM